MKKLRTFQCAICRKSVATTWTEEEARAMQHVNWPDAKDEDCLPLCWDCHQAAMKLFNNKSRAKALAKGER